MKVKFATIGTNFITDLFLEAAGKVDAFQLKGVYSRSRKKGEEYAKKYGADLVFDNLDRLAACQEVDAVYIASPNSFHKSQSIQMLKSGKHVLCEKTIASNQAELIEMKKASFENKAVLLEAMRSAHSPGFAAMKDNLPKLGVIRRASFQFCQYSRRYDNFKKGIVENAFQPLFSNGALMDIGVYCVYPLVALFGRPSKVMSSSLKLSNGVDGAGTILLEYDQMQGELLYSKITNSKAPSQIQGEDGTMVIERIQNPQSVRIYDRAGNEEVLEIPTVENDMVYEIRSFIKLVKEGRVDHPYLRESMLELELMDEVRRQQGIWFPADQ